MYLVVQFHRIIYGLHANWNQATSFIYLRELTCFDLILKYKTYDHSFAGIKLIIDFVPNHVSNKHMWFNESKKGNSPSNEYRDFFIWANGTNGGPPNNWVRGRSSHKEC